VTLYHGSNCEVREPRLIKPSRNLDFGPGFYTTLNRQQAEAFALRVARNRGDGVATLNTYAIDESTAFPLCDLASFSGPTDAWLDFVCDNRTGRYAGPRYDFIFGPVANDDVFTSLYLYLGGQLSRDEVMVRLKVKQLYNQLVFASEKALSFVRFQGSEVVHG